MHAWTCAHAHAPSLPTTGHASVHQPVLIYLTFTHCRERNEDEARDTFKTLKNQHIGDANAHLYHQWAALEAKAGEISKAISILQKGIKERAQPAK